jgi:hypothetical protein
LRGAERERGKIRVVPQTPVRLEDHAVTFTPSRFARWRGEAAWTVPYCEIMGLTLTEPQGLRRGRLLLKPSPGREPCTIEFGSGELHAMRRLHQEIWTRVGRARDGRSAQGERPSEPGL